MARLPCLLPFLLLIGVHASVSHGSPLPPTYDTSICSKSSDCGGINISYPFYLSNAIGETDNYTPFSCGYTDLKVTCSMEEGKQTPIIQLSGSNYTIIQEILYDKSMVVLADTDALRAGKCPRVRHNVTFGRAYEWLEYTGSRDNLTFFFGCKDTPIDPWPAGFFTDMYQINCEEFSDGPGNGVSFVFNSSELDALLEYELARHCHEVIVVPVNGDLLMATNQTTLPTGGPGGYGGVLDKGFELAWNSRKDEQCHQCEQSQGQCAYSQNRGFLGCLCSTPRIAQPAALPSTRGKSFDSDPSILLPSANPAISRSSGMASQHSDILASR